MNYTKAIRVAHKKRAKTGYECFVFWDWEWEEYGVCTAGQYESDPDFQEIKEEEVCYSTETGGFVGCPYIPKRRLTS